jgi:hypothetical protein
LSEYSGPLFIEKRELCDIVEKNKEIGTFDSKEVKIK